MVIAELKKILKFWLDKGVDGFNLDSFNNLVESQSMDHDLDASFDLVKEFRSVVDTFGQETDSSRILVALTNLDTVELGPLYGQDIDENHIGQLFHLVAGKPLAAAAPTDSIFSTMFFCRKNGAAHNLFIFPKRLGLAR